MMAMMVAFSLQAHPDGATPYYYPSTFIYGFVDGCAEKIEQSQMDWVGQMWPENVRSVCGCVVDALRHSMEYNEVEGEEPTPMVQAIVDVTLPICIQEEQINVLQKDSSLGD